MSAEKDKRTWQTRAIAMVCITAIELYALHLGHNGLLLVLAVGMVAFIAGEGAGYLRAVIRQPRRPDGGTRQTEEQPESE